jgi:hypothetical protein
MVPSTAITIHIGNTAPKLKVSRHPFATSFVVQHTNDGLRLLYASRTIRPVIWQAPPNEEKPSELITVNTGGALGYSLSQASKDKIHASEHDLITFDWAPTPSQPPRAVAISHKAKEDSYIEIRTILPGQAPIIEELPLHI